MKPEDFEKQLEQQLKEHFSADIEILGKVVHFANWLEEGVEKTGDPMIRKVLVNYVKLFEEYLTHTEEDAE